MKKIITSYTFDASAQTVVSSSFTSLERILLITNVTDNIIIYNFADPTKGGSLSGTTLTLDYDTTTMSDTDSLQVFVESDEAVQVQDAAYSAGQVAIVGGVRRDADTSPVSADGDVHPAIYDESGRLKVSTYPGSIPSYTDTITSNGDVVSLDTTRYSNITIYCKGTFSTVNVTFEGSVDGGTTWFGVQGVRTNANTVELTTGNLSAAPAYAWEFSVNALTNFRVRATAFTSGTQTWVFSPGVYATEPIPAIQTHPVTGSGNFAVTVAAAATSIAKAEDAAHVSGDVGVPGLYIRNDAATVNTSATGDYSNGRVDSFGQQAFIPGAATAVTATSVNDAATSTSLLASNTARKGVIIRNDSSSILYIKLGATATTSEEIKLYQDDEYIMDLPIYTGAIDGIWSADSTGAARILEIT